MNKKKRYRRKNKKQEMQKEMQQDKKCECHDNKECNHECNKCKSKIKNNKVENTHCEYDFMKLDTNDDKKIFCEKLFKDIEDCYNHLSHNKVRNVMDVINKYFLYYDKEDNVLLDLTMINMLKKVSGNKVKPVWEKVSSGVGINIHIGLEYKGMVFSLYKDFE